MEEKKKGNPWRFAFLALAVLGLLNFLPGIFAGILLLWLNLKANVSPNYDHAASVGVIGGADSPTAIFLTSPAWTVYILPVLMLAVGIAGYFWLKKRT